ncbi:MAG: hypothetical protein RLZ23_1225, partial [Actinomycetota bacterium]
IQLPSDVIPGDLIATPATGHMDARWRATTTMCPVLPL